MFWLLQPSVIISRKEFLYFVEMEEPEGTFSHIENCNIGCTARGQPSSYCISASSWESQTTSDSLQMMRKKNFSAVSQFLQRDASASENQLKIEAYTVRKQFCFPPKGARSSSIFSLKMLLFFSRSLLHSLASALFLAVEEISWDLHGYGELCILSPNTYDIPSTFPHKLLVFILKLLNIIPDQTRKYQRCEGHIS